MNADIIDRLRNASALTRKDLFPLCADALDEIEQLRALITAWCDACDRAGNLLNLDPLPDERAAFAAELELRKAVGR